MRRAHRLRFGAIMVATGAALVLVAAASSGVIENGTFHDEGEFVFEDFCDVEGLTIDGAFTVDGRGRAVPHGRDGLVYLTENIRSTTVLTNPDTNKTVSELLTVVSKDLKVTDNGDGTSTIRMLGAGNDVIYDANGKAIWRSPGQFQFEILVDNGGTPTDPEDDEFLEDLGLVRDESGPQPDFCEAVVPALT